MCVSDVPALRFICLLNLYAGHEMDVRDLQFADGTFDVAVDKGNRPFWSHVGSKFSLHKGTMDAMMTAKGSVWVSNLGVAIKPRV